MVDLKPASAGSLSACGGAEVKALSTGDDAPVAPAAAAAAAALENGGVVLRPAPTAGANAGGARVTVAAAAPPSFHANGDDGDADEDEAVTIATAAASDAPVLNTTAPVAPLADASADADADAVAGGMTGGACTRRNRGVVHCSSPSSGATACAKALYSADCSQCCAGQT